MGNRNKRFRKEDPEARKARLERDRIARLESEARRPQVEALALLLAHRWRDEMQSGGGDAQDKFLQWISDNAVNGESLFVEYTDYGFDRSATRILGTGRHHHLPRFKTVGDLLGEPNGTISPTYQSGRGMRADTLSDDAHTHSSDIMQKWLLSQPEMEAEADSDILAEIQSEFMQQTDMMGIDSSEWTYALMDLPLEQVIRSHSTEPDPEANFEPGIDPELPIGLSSFLSRFPVGLKDHHLTFVTPDGTATFASDNAYHLKAWWAQESQLIRLFANRHTVLNRRIFTPMKDLESGLPIKKLSSCFINAEGAVEMTAEDTRLAFETDAATGQKLDPMKAVVYEDF